MHILSLSKKKKGMEMYRIWNSKCVGTLVIAAGYNKMKKSHPYYSYCDLTNKEYRPATATNV